MAAKFLHSLVLSTLMVGVAFVSGTSASEPRTSAVNFHETKFASELGATLPPQGWVDFCKREPQECGGPSAQRVRVKLDDERWKELETVNRIVNQFIEPATDEELYSRPELWTFPDGRGDCEDYVLLKRHQLIALGWPREALLITVVLDHEQLGHAVLTVVTDRGDLVLDNQQPQILPWMATGYQFVKRQAQVHPAMWVALDPLASGRLRYTSSESSVGGNR